MPASLNLNQSFLPEALAGLSNVAVLHGEVERRRMNQIRAASYLHLFDLLETCVAEAARAHAMRDIDARDMLAPLLRLDVFDHNEMFHEFERAFEESFPVSPKLVPRPRDLDEVLDGAVPLSLLILALHLKLVTQQHYLACVRGDESLEPHFVKILKEHWSMECGRSRSAESPSPTHAIQQALAAVLPGRVPAALRDYRRIVFCLDDVLCRQSELDVETLESLGSRPLSTSDHETLASAQLDALRKTFITFGIVNAAFVYAMRTLGPTAPATLAGVVSALSTR